MSKRKPVDDDTDVEDTGKWARSSDGSRMRFPAPSVPADIPSTWGFGEPAPLHVESSAPTTISSSGYVSSLFSRVGAHESKEYRTVGQTPSVVPSAATIGRLNYQNLDIRNPPISTSSPPYSPAALPHEPITLPKATSPAKDAENYLYELKLLAEGMGLERIKIPPVRETACRRWSCVFIFNGTRFESGDDFMKPEDARNETAYQVIQELDRALAGAGNLVNLVSIAREVSLGNRLFPMKVEDFLGCSSEGRRIADRLRQVANMIGASPKFENEAENIGERRPRYRQRIQLGDEIFGWSGWCGERRFATDEATRIAVQAIQEDLGCYYLKGWNKKLQARAGAQVMAGSEEGPDNGLHSDRSDKSLAKSLSRILYSAVYATLWAPGVRASDVEGVVTIAVRYVVHEVRYPVTSDFSYDYEAWIA
ncbi:hypothetical protein HDU93_001238 [Gonapodya sp. JEL0774]|nr:hypothetical protein HDU93_001238 [Gonapodya sp. JEL0774]